MVNWIIVVFLASTIILAGFLAILFLAFFHNARFTSHVKKVNYKLWLDKRHENTIGIPLPIYLLNPFLLSEECEYRQDDKFLKLRNKACLSLRIFRIYFFTFATVLTLSFLSFFVYTIFFE